MDAFEQAAVAVEEGAVDSGGAGEAGDGDVRAFAASLDWLTIYYLPPYAPDLNPVEGIWSLLRRGWLSNVASSSPDTTAAPGERVRVRPQPETGLRRQEQRSFRTVPGHRRAGRFVRRVPLRPHLRGRH
ncbi:hypothetical protein GCM10027072_45570 [Streptomyces bullii]